jgi:hypothetical protein
MAINELDFSLINWLFNLQLKAIVNDNEFTINEKIKELIDLKEEVSTIDIDTKKKFLLDKEKVEEESKNGVQNWFSDLGKFLMNVNTPQQEKQFIEQINYILNEIENEINKLRGLKKEQVKTKESILSHNEILLLIDCLKKQHFITKSSQKAGEGFFILSGYSKNTIKNGLPNPFYTDDEIDKMIKNMDEIIGYLEVLKKKN